MCFVNAADRALLPSRSRSRLLLERAGRARNECSAARGDGREKKVAPVPRFVMDSLTHHVESVSERFAHLLHMTLSLAFDDVPPSSAAAGAVLVNGQTTAEYVAGIDYRRVVHTLLRFKCAHPQDLPSLFALILVYVRQMKVRLALPLLEQMIVWFDVPNVVYCIAFLAHVWLLDDPLPLADWHGIAEGVVKGVNLNKCVRNCLRILKYRLFVNQTQSRAAMLTLEYADQNRYGEPAHDALLLQKAQPVRGPRGNQEEPPKREPSEPRLSLQSLRAGAGPGRYADLARQRAAQGPAARPSHAPRAPFGPPRRA